MDLDVSQISMVLITSVVVMAYTIRGATGFGSGLVAVPLLSIWLPLTLVVPIVAILDAFASFILGIGSRRVIQWKEILRLLPFSALGIVGSVFIIKYVDGDILKMLLGIFVIAYGHLLLLSARRQGMIASYWAVPWGSLGGLVNSLFGTGGPFYVIYLQLRNLDKKQIRATITTLLLLDGLGRMVGYGSAGFFTTSSLTMALLCLPLCAIALYVGSCLHRYLNGDLFSKLIAVLLIISGTTLLLGT